MIPPAVIREDDLNQLIQPPLIYVYLACNANKRGCDVQLELNQRNQWNK